MTGLASIDVLHLPADKPVTPHQRGASFSWPLSLLLVLVAHLAAAWWLLATHNRPPPLSQPLPAIMLDMAPAPMPAPPRPPASQEPDYHAMPHPPVPQAQAPAVEPMPMPTAPADVALPQPAKKLPPKQVQKPKPVKPKKAETVALQAAQPAPTAAASAPPADNAAQQGAVQQQKEAALAAASLAAKSNWLGEVVQHIAKFKRIPRSRLRVPLRAVIAFAIDREGKLLSQHLLQSSGRDEIDEEALAWIRRADPLPKPPAEISDGDLSQGFIIPVDFMPR